MATLVQRKFGTDLSNVNQDAMAKRLAGKAKTVSTQSVHITPASEVPATETFPTKSDSIETQIDEEFEKLALESDIPSLPVATPQETNMAKSIYGIQFLLQFQKICTEPVDFLVPEIAKDKYVAPKFTPVFNRNGSRPSTPSTGSAKKNLSSYREKSPFTKSSGGGVVFVPVQKKSESPAAELFLQHLNTNSAFADVHSPMVSTKAEPEVINLEIVPQVLKFEDDIASPAKVVEPASSVESPSSVKNVQLEWRPKSAKKEKPRETDEKRLAARQKQIDIGKATTGYKNFITQIPKSSRTKEHPRTPNKNQVCSKRSWDGQVRKWRRMLHFYDPETKTEDMEAREKDEEEIISASDSEEEEEDSIIPTDLAAAMASVKPRSIVMNLEQVLAAEDAITL